jgi:hypothetical protein
MIFIKRLGGALDGTFSQKASTCYNYTFGPRPLGALAPFDFLFWHGPLTVTWAELGFKVYQKICSHGKAPYPLGPNCRFLKNHVNFASFPPFDFAFPLP